MKCGDCATEMQLISRIGDYVKLKCPACGRITEGEIFPQDLLDIMRGPVFELYIRLPRDEPPAQLAAKLKTIVELRHKTVHELYKAAQSGDDLYLATVHQSSAESFLTRLREGGFDVYLKPADKTVT